MNALPGENAGVIRVEPDDETSHDLEALARELFNGGCQIQPHVLNLLCLGKRFLRGGLDTNEDRKPIRSRLATCKPSVA